jgi:hypothetical protein
MGTRHVNSWMKDRPTTIRAPDEKSGQGSSVFRVMTPPPTCTFGIFAFVD